MEAFCSDAIDILAFTAMAHHKRHMPTLTRLIAFVVVIAAIAYAAMYALANFVQPQTQEMRVEIPASKLKPVPIAPAPSADGTASTDVPAAETTTPSQE
ncbi:hypothetical protein FHW03_000144 [Ochrobactrum sp. RH2CCR150]|nr:hypothetical protein [Ochrobactrum sp. RH2CCR150]